MQTGRNDPCPCGSGRKYKRCCLEPDARGEHARHVLGLADGGVGAPAPGRAAPRLDLPDVPVAADWQADLVPLAAAFADDPGARPAVALVVADPQVLHVDVLSHPPAEPAEVAAVLEGALLAAAKSAAATPAVVEVRFAPVAAALAARLAPRGVAVREARELPALDGAVRSFSRHVLHPDAADGLRVAVVQTWAGWGLPRDVVARLFAAAAAFHEAAPWRELTNSHVLHAELPDGGVWALSVLGNGGQEFGLALYADPAELAATLRGDRPPGERLAQLVGAVLSLTFASRDDLPRPMRQEVREARWSVAGPSAHPVLWALNTPGGGVTRRQMEELVALLGVVPRFVGRHRRGLAGEEPLSLPLRWTDAATGIALRYEGLRVEMGGGLWEVPAALAPAGPEGERAEPGARLVAVGASDEEAAAADDGERELVARFAAHLRSDEGGGLSAATTRRHADAAGLLVDFLAYDQAVPLRAATEYDLRLFLYDWYPRTVRASDTAVRALPGSLRRFVEYLADREGIIYPWALPILADRDAFVERCENAPVGFWWSPGVREWRDELHANLDARVLLHDRGAPAGLRWDVPMGPVQAALADELQRRWLGWRDDVIRAGTTAPEAVRTLVVPRQRAWERAPLDAPDGPTRAAAIAREQADMPELPASAASGAGDALPAGLEAMLDALLPENDGGLVETVRRIAERMAAKGARKTAAKKTAAKKTAAKKTAARKTAAPGRPATGLRLRVALAGIRPRIWRRLELPDTTTLARLHDILQVAMGWEQAHLWAFEIGGERYGDEPDEWDEVRPAGRTTLRRLGLERGSRFVYEYDFGDGWEHDVRVERVVPLPADAPPVRCLAGERACPPEDCGGPWGYAELLETLADPNHPEHAEMLDWTGGEFDPEEFDLELVNRRLARL